MTTPVRLIPAWGLHASDLRAIAANILGDAAELSVQLVLQADEDERNRLADAGAADDYDDDWAVMERNSGRDAAAVLLGAAQRVDDLEAEQVAAIRRIEPRWVGRCAHNSLRTLWDDALEAAVAEIIGRFGFGIVRTD